ncbi:hypothetical protein BFL35_15945 [Clavibacter michiganensis]|nr:hypothetical protein BFL35_15945 [Clavibacter michiganensis]
MSTLFVDESKAKGYTMVAVAVAAHDAPALRQQVRALVLPGQRRIHFTNESDSRRRAVLARLRDLGIRADVVHSDDRSELAARLSCLAAVVDLAAYRRDARIVLERDDSIEQIDRRFLFDQVDRRGLRGALSYTHETAHQEPLLGAADALAWSWTKGGDWPRRIAPMLEAADDPTR